MSDEYCDLCMVSVDYRLARIITVDGEQKIICEECAKKIEAAPSVEIIPNGDVEV